MAAHAQRKLPAFAIYGRDVQDMADTSVPADVREKILLWAKAAIAAGTLKGKSYVNIGGPCMGIAGSYIDAQMFQEYFGLRTEWLDQVEIERRIARGIFDPEEFAKAKAWREQYCREGWDKNEGGEFAHTREQKDAEWERVIKQTLIIRDIMIGNPRLAELGFVEEAAGRNALVGGVQGQRQWTDHFPNHDFSEAMLCSSFDWNGIREPMVLATENDTLNAMSMLMSHLLNDSAACFADVRTYWSPDAIERVTGWKPAGKAEGGLIHLINSGAAALDGCGAMRGSDGQPAMKPFWEMTGEDADACLSATQWCPADNGYFRGGGFSSMFETQVEMPVTMVHMNKIEGLGPVLQIAEGYTAVLPEHVSQALQKRTDPTWPTTWFVPRTTGEGSFEDVYSVMANWGANPRLLQLRPYRRPPDHPRQHAPHSGRDAQRCSPRCFPTARLVGVRYRQPGKRRLSRLRQLWPDLWITRKDGFKMLKGIPSILSPELLKILMEMGHGDEICLGDGNFPAESMGIGSLVVRSDGHGIPELLDAILRLLPLDTYSEKPVCLMEVVPGDTVETPIWKTYEGIIARHDSRAADAVQNIERFAFYDRGPRLLCDCRDR